MYQPYDYYTQSSADYFGLQPTSVKGRDNPSVLRHKRYLWAKLYSVYELGIPKEWRLDWFRYWTFQVGSGAVIYTNEYGWVYNPYGVSELGLYYHPKEIVCTSPWFKEKIGVIGVNAEIVHIMDDYQGLDDLVTSYAVRLANIDKNIEINLMNCNTTMSSEVESKKEADEVKEAYANATTGKPFVVVKKGITGQKGITTFLPNVRNNYLVDEYLQAKRSIVNEFLTEIGIKNANYDKKERLNSQEVNQNNDETGAIVTVIYENLKDSFDRVNKLTGLNLTVKRRYNYEEKEGEEDASDAVRNAAI